MKKEDSAEDIQQLKETANKIKEALEGGQMESFIIWRDYEFKTFFDLNDKPYSELKEFKEKYFIDIYHGFLYMGMFSGNRMGTFIALS